MRKLSRILTNVINIGYLLYGFLFLGLLALFNTGKSGFMGVDNNWLTQIVGFTAIAAILFRFYLLLSMKKQKKWKVPHVYPLLIFDTLVILGSQYADYTQLTQFGNSYVYGDELFRDSFFLGEFALIIVVLIINLALNLIARNNHQKTT